MISVRIFLNWVSWHELIPSFPVISSTSILPKQYTSYAHVAVAGDPGILGIVRTINKLEVFMNLIL